MNYRLLFICCFVFLLVGCSTTTDNIYNTCLGKIAVDFCMDNGLELSYLNSDAFIGRVYSFDCLTTDRQQVEHYFSRQEKLDCKELAYGNLSLV